MISFLIGIITAAIVFYMSMIYGNAALALLGCFMCVFMVLTFIALLVKAHRAVAAINIPIAIATQGESIRVSLFCRLKEAGFDGVKYRVTVKNNLSGEKSTKWLSGGSDFLYSVNLCGNYEFELVRIKLYDFSRLFYVTKRVKKYANVEVMPQIDEIPVRVTDRVRNFFGDSDIYDDLRPGYDPSEEAIKDRLEKTGRLPKAIIPVHLYGMPVKMDEVMEVANRYGIPVLEDAAEALGSEYKGQKCGTFGEYGVLSFNGNKIITTSGGGALVCPNEERAKRALFYATQAREQAPHYQHEKIGYNYRMSNICAGIGRGQMFVLDEHIARRRVIHDLYVKLLAGVKGVKVMCQPEGGDFNSNYWLTCITVDPSIAGKTREDIRLKLDAENIETRPLWKPMHLQPVFKDAPFYGNGTSERLFEMGLCLPSGPTLTDEDIERVTKVIYNL